MAKIKMNRETWLEQAIVALDKAFFTENGYELPKKLQVSCGFPFASSKAIGQCWSPSRSADKTTQMFISPTEANPNTVLAILLHEMIHACVGTEAGHKGPFRKLAKQFGLAGRMTATYVEGGTDLHMALKVMVGRLGAYPNAAMTKSTKKGSGGSGWVRLMSITEETYTVMVSPRKLEEFGYPMDPWGNMMEVKQ